MFRSAEDRRVTCRAEARPTVERAPTAPPTHPVGRASARQPTAYALLLALTLCGAAHAQSDDTREELRAFEPTGPVTLTADRAEWVQGGEMQYRGNVSLQSGTLTLRGAQMTVKQFADGQFEAWVTGKPARLIHTGTPGAEGIAAQPVDAEAGRMDYDSRTGVIRLSVDAKLLRGTDRISGEQIDYVVAERRIRAAGGQSGQVRIVIQPPPRSGAQQPQQQTPAEQTPQPQQAPTPEPEPQP